MHLYAAVVRFTAAIDRSALVLSGQAGWCARFTTSLDDCFVLASCVLFFAQQSSRHGAMNSHQGHLVPALRCVLCTGHHWGGVHCRAVRTCVFVACAQARKQVVCMAGASVGGPLVLGKRQSGTEGTRCFAGTSAWHLAACGCTAPPYRPVSLCRQVVAGWPLQACCWSRWRFE